MPRVVSVPRNSVIMCLDVLILPKLVNNYSMWYYIENDVLIIKTQHEFFTVPEGKNNFYKQVYLTVDHKAMYLFDLSKLVINF